MSIEEKRRPRFEFYAESIGYPLKTDNIGYCHPETTRLWRTWNAALDSVLIKLPEIEWPEDFEVTRESDPEEYEALEARAGCQETVLHLCKRAIGAAGLKVAP